MSDQRLREPLSPNHSPSSLTGVAIILAATAIGKKLPFAAGLIGVMPLTGALALVWIYMESHGDAGAMQQFTKGALWGILPSILFFVVALLCFRKGLSAEGAICHILIQRI